MEKLNFETVLVEASRLPIVRVDRELFLHKEFKDKYSKDIVDLAIEYSPAYAGIKTSDIDKIAKWLSGPHCRNVVRSICFESYCGRNCFRQKRHLNVEIAEICFIM